MKIIKGEIRNNCQVRNHLDIRCNVKCIPAEETVVERCSNGMHWSEEEPLFGNFIVKESLDGGWQQDTNHRQKRLFFSTSLFLSAIVGLHILVFASMVTYGAKTIADSTTQKIVAAECESRTADILAAGLDRLQDQITLNGMINVLLIESVDLL